MAKDSTTIKTKNRQMRQEAIREQLSNGGHLQHVVDIANKLADETLELDSLMIQRLKAASDIKCKLLAKYIPDLKSTEITTETDEDGKPTGIRVMFVNPDSKATS